MVQKEKEEEKRELPFPTKKEEFFEIPNKYSKYFTGDIDKVNYAINSFKLNYEKLDDIKDSKKRFRMALRNMKRDNYGKKDLDGNNIELSERGLHEVEVFLKSLEHPIKNGYEINEKDYNSAITKVKMSQEISKMYDPKLSLKENFENIKEKYAKVTNKYNEEFFKKIAEYEKDYQELLELEKQQAMFETHNKRAEKGEIIVEMSDTIGKIGISMPDYEYFSLYDVLQVAEINNKPHLVAHAIQHILENAESFELNGKKVTKEQRKEIINHLNRDGPQEMVKKIDSFEKKV